MAGEIRDPIEGVTTRTTKDELMGRLKQASKDLRGLRAKLNKQETERLTKLEEVEKRVREKYAARPSNPVQNVIVSGTAEELKETAEFLDEFGMTLLPTMLQRLSAGLDALLDRQKDQEDDQ